jgi:Divergent InlB B-repeat domain/Fibronectin type III domain
MSLAKQGAGMRHISPTKFRATWAALLALALLLGPSANADPSLVLAWNPSASPEVVGYLVYYGNDGTNLASAVDVGTNTSVTMPGLQAGTTNAFEVVGYDINGVQSPPSNLIEYSVPTVTEMIISQTNAGSEFTLLIGGSTTNGTFVQKLKGKVFEPGKRYTLTAAPGKGAVFTGWVSNGMVVSTTATYSFVLGSNEVLQANFIPNPYLPAVGSYRGLFYVANAVSAENSGSFSASVTSAGAFTASLALGAVNYSFAGAFNPLSGTAPVKTFHRPGLSNITVQLQLDFSGGPMTGSVSDGTWTADLLANPAIYSHTNLAPQAGRYTMLIPGANNSAGQPGGNGFAAVTVNTLGDVSLSGTLGDGTAFTSSSVVASQGQWPFYVALYGGKGSILGWLSFATNGDVNGQIDWFKTPEATAKFYPGGFDFGAEIIGSPYKYTNGLPVLGFTDGDGLLSLTDGDLSESITNQVVLGAMPATESFTNKLSVLNSTGMFHGSVINPATRKPIALRGIVLQNQNFGAGCFLGTNQSGSVYLSPAP